MMSRFAFRSSSGIWSRFELGPLHEMLPSGADSVKARASFFIFGPKLFKGAAYGFWDNGARPIFARSDWQEALGEPSGSHTGNSLHGLGR